MRSKIVGFKLRQLWVNKQIKPLITRECQNWTISIIASISNKPLIYLYIHYY